MSFGKDMKGKTSHEVIVRVQDSELRLLDALHHFISMRVDSDKKYALSLSKMLNAAVKYENSGFKDCCSVFGAWDVILQETDSLIKIMRSNSDHLQFSTLEILSQLINEKKQAKKKYLDERNRLDSDFLKVQDEMTKNRMEYSKSVERLNLDKAKYHDLYSKGKPGPKVDEAKCKFFRSAVHLHKIHNDYIISVNGTQEHQAVLRETTLPALLDCHQEEQEAFVHKIKFILEDFSKHTDTCREDFQTLTKNIQHAIQAIQPGKEYSGTFIDLYKSSLTPPTDFTFDESLLDNYSGSLKANVIEINDLTVELLQERLTKLTEEIEEIKKKIQTISAEQQTTSIEANRLSVCLGQEYSIENVNNYLAKRTQTENCSREILELEGSLRKLEKLAFLIQQPLDKLGSNPAPPASDIHENGELDILSTSSSSSQGTLKDTTLMKLAKMNPFKTKVREGNGQTGMYVDDNNTEDKAVKKKASPGYEKHVPMGASNSMMSMTKLREQGHLVDMNVSEAKSRIADEQWFHGILPREEVQRLLVSDGDFLVRESKNKKTSETQFVLSAYWQGHRHFIIQFIPDQGWHFEGKAYPTIQELVRRQHESGQPLTTKSGVILTTPVLREWELLNDDIELTERIGTGNFGEVFKGMYKNTLEVAVKTCKDTLTEDQKIKFLQEGRILKQYKHPNIVKYIGIAAQKQPVMIVMEFIPKGALLSFLKVHAASQTAKQKVQMCVDAASGMEYLEGRGCIHRDLAARNCLVGENNVIKISDFGMSREEQVYSVSSVNNQVPIKWTAPEALNFAKYTSLCDVWSFGVLMWEIFSGGKTPYPGMTNIKARQWIEDGKRMEAPTGTPDAVYKLMLQCWEYVDEKRPHFSTVHKTLKDIVKKV